MKTKAERRHQNKRIQEKRSKKWGYLGLRGANHQGKLRKTHFGCGCSMCKPWKHGFDKQFKPSERRKLQTEE